MPSFIDITGKRFGRYKVLSQIKERRDNKIYWKCKCDCGNVRAVLGSNLSSGKSEGCGCLNGKTIVHGHNRRGKVTREYRCWTNMLTRCYSEKCKYYPDYGGRGIKVCNRWHTFSNFLEDMGECPSKLTLDRKNNNGSYTPKNCKWSTRKEQSLNRRNTLPDIVFRGKKQSLQNWAADLNVTYHSLHTRLYKLGWSVHKTFTTPVRFRSRSL